MKNLCEARLKKVRYRLRQHLMLQSEDKGWHETFVDLKKEHDVLKEQMEEWTAAASTTGKQQKRTAAKNETTKEAKLPPNLPKFKPGDVPNFLR